MLTMTKQEYATKPKDYRSIIDGKPYLMMYNDKTGGTELVPVEIKRNPTLATFKSFIKKTPNLYIATKSSFDGMVDCCMPCENQGFTPIQASDRNHEHTLGIAGVWLVLGGGDRFYTFEDDHFIGFEVYNCCGHFYVATKKAV